MALAAFSIMQTPSPSTTYVAPSGNTYLSTGTQPGLIFNVVAGDVANLEALGCVLILPRNEVTTASSPSGSNDFTQGYGVGSLWIYISSGTYAQYGCTAMTTSPGGATWVLLSTTAPSAPVIESIAGASYTVQSTDSGKILTIDGGIFQAITFPAASGLGSGFYCTIINTETMPIGKGVAGLQGNNFTLYPGESFDIFNNAGVLTVKDAQSPGGNTSPPKRYRVSTVQLYVDKGLGSDNPMVADGLGTGARARASITQAYSDMRTNFDHNSSFPTINIAAHSGGYQESLTMGGQPVGAPVFFFAGPSALGVLWQPLNSSEPYCMLPGDGCVFEYSNIQFDATNTGVGGTGIEFHQTAIGDMNTGCGMGGFGPSIGNFWASDGCGATINLNDSYAVNGAAGTFNHVSVHSESMCNHAGGITITISNTPNIGGAWFTTGGGGTISLGSSCTWSGSVTGAGAKWSAGPHSEIALSGNAANIPGSVAGLPSTGVSPTGATGWATA